VIYERTFPIRLQYVDAAGIVFFGRYFELMHDVYESFLEELGYGLAAAIAEGRIIMPIAAAEARYHRPMRHGDVIKARLRLTALKRSSFVVTTDFLGVDDDPRATLVTTHVAVARETMRPVPLPDGLRGALSGYLE
jgi:YbgC/YbaW family acyl-CoA thioester hydrolase